MAPNEKPGTKSLRDQYPGSVPLTGSGGETFKWDAAGKTLKGRFLRLKEGGSGKGQFALIDTGKRVETCSAPSQLAEALEATKPGTMVVIRYTGDEESKSGGIDPETQKPFRFKNFEVVALPD